MVGESRAQGAQKCYQDEGAQACHAPDLILDQPSLAFSADECANEKGY